MQNTNSLFKKILKRNEFYLFLVIAVLSLFLTIINSDFFTLENFLDLLVSYSFLGILAAGLLVVLISGGIDISFTAVATVAQYVMASYVIANGGNFFLAILISCLIGIALGAINALLIYSFKVPAIIITVATLNIFQGILIFVTKGRWMYNFPRWFSRIKLFEFNINENIYAFNIPILALLMVLFLTWLILNHSKIGRKIYAMGGNREAARRAGFNIFRLHLFVYCYMGFLAGIASMIQAQIMQTVAPNSIVGRELEVLAAVVLGGASLAGGQGSLLGTVLGVSLMAIMQNGLILLGVSSYWHNIFIGLVIIVSVSITAYQRTTARASEGRSVEI